MDTQKTRTCTHARSLRMLLALLLSFAPTLSAQGELPQWEPDSTAERASIPDVYKGDLSGLFRSVEAWEASRVALGQRISELQAQEGRLAEPKAMRECLDLYCELHNGIKRLTL